MRINIQTKLFLLLAGLTAIILLGVLYAITTTVSEKIEEKIIDDFKNTQAFFQKQQSLIYERLVESCYLIGENSTFKANVAEQDPATVYFVVDEFSNFAKVDLFIVTDNRGMVLARHGAPDKYGDDLTNRPSIARALNGIEPEFEINWAELWEVNNQPFQVVTYPIFTANSNAILGTISLGTQITRHEATALKGDSKIDISMFLKNLLVASTITDSLTDSFTKSIEKFLSENKPVIDAVLLTLSPSDAFTTTINNEEVYAFLSPLGEGIPAFYLATVPKALELQILDALQNNIFLTAAISLVITIILALVLGRTFSKPVLRLSNGMNKVKKGDLSTFVKPSTKDEIGLLTQSFNEMIVGLRERLHLTKYVGSHTLDMIKQSSDAQVELGGDRKELAVLFSDVRGFTSFSESRTPEEVINMLNRFLGIQAELVTLYGGSVDKFVGDEMVALFGGNDAIEKALDCAVKIQKLIKKERESDNSSINVGIGINYGSVILGNMGASERMDYTVIGAAVNLGARLCSAAEPGKILIRRELLNGLQHKYQIGQSRMMNFKGISKEIEIVEVFGE